MRQPDGVLVLALIQDLLRQLKLPFSEHVFLEETGFNLQSTFNSNVNSEALALFRLGNYQNSSIVDGLLDWYENQCGEKTILVSSQTDGMDDEKVIRSI